MINFFSKKHSTIVFYLVLFISSSTFGFGPSLNKYDPFCTVGPEGTDPFPALATSEAGEPGMFYLELSPFHMEVKTARAPDGSSATIPTSSGSTGTQFSVFEENGKWNLPGFFYPFAEAIFNPSLVPATSSPTPNQVRDLLPLGWRLSVDLPVIPANSVSEVVDAPNRNSVQNIALAIFGGASNYTNANYGEFVDSLFAAAFPGLSKDQVYKTTDFDDAKLSKRNWKSSSSVNYGAVTNDYRKFLCPSTAKSATTIGFDQSTAGSVGSFLTVNSAGVVHYSKYTREGIRAKMVFNLAPGIRIWAQSGLCQHRTDVRFFESIDPSLGLSGQIDAENGKAITNQLFFHPNFQKIAKIFKLDVSNVNDWSAEDTYAAIDLSAPVVFTSQNGVAQSIRVWPTVSIGAWLPTSRKQAKSDLVSVFRVPTGSDGHYGVSGSASLNFDLKGSFIFNFGGAFSVFNTRSVDREMVLVNSLQVGLSPLVTSVSRKPGKTYCAWAALFSRKYQEYFSASFQYMMAAHRKDEITVTDEVLRPIFDGTNFDNFEAFNGLQNQMNRTAWLRHDLYAGIIIEPTPNIHFAGGFTINTFGYGVPKTKTLSVSAKFTL